MRPRGEIQLRETVEAVRILAAARGLAAAPAPVADAEAEDPGRTVVPGDEPSTPPEAALPASEVDEPFDAPARGSSGIDVVGTAGGGGAEGSAGAVVGAGRGGGVEDGGSGGGLGAGGRGGNSSAAAGPAMPPVNTSTARSPQRLT